MTQSMKGRPQEFVHDRDGQTGAEPVFAELGSAPPRFARSVVADGLPNGVA